MATRQIGPLKFNISRRGIAYKWRDGEIHRFAFQQPEAANDDAYEADQPYDEGYDQGYDDGYQEGYADEYADENYEEEYMPAGLMGYFYQKEWLVWIALVVLPPLGIYVLWKKQQYELPTRAGISAASLVWCILLLVLLFSGIFGGSGDPKTNQADNITQVTNAPTSAIPTMKATTAPTMAPTPKPSPTPQAGSGITSSGQNTVTGNGSENPTEETVYFTPNGQYYHKQSVCGVMTEGTASTLSYAQSLGKTSCPDCYGMGGTTGTGELGSVVTADTFYATSGGTWFHKEADSCGMKDSSPISRADAEARGQTACPKCLGVYSRDGGSWYHSTPNCASGLKNAEIVSLETAKYRKQTECPYCMGNTDDTNVYWHTRGGDHYHLDKTCTGMKNATQCTLAVAVKAGQTACPTCIGTANKGTAYYCTDNGTWYHTDKNCDGMKNAKQVTKAAAENNGKKPCPTCVGKVTSSFTNKVWFTKDGQWYHIEDDCQGMTNAVQGTIDQAKKYDKTACPECIGSTSAKVYGRKDGKHYHVVSDCSGMTGASQITVKTAQKAGLTACPTCIGGGSTNANTGYTSTGEKVEVYCTVDGEHYHSYPTCSGMKNAGGTTIARATKGGKTPCPECIKTTASENGAKPGYTSWGEKIEVYCTEGGTYYHANATCTDMKNAGGTTIARATKGGKVPCPTCIGTTSSGNSKTVYATKYGTYYHLKDNCSGMAGANEYTVASASAAGKRACPKCIGATDSKVYLTKAGDYYHVKSNCGGMTNPSFVSLKDAIALGKDYCPDCIGHDSAIAKKYGTVSKPDTDKDDDGNTNAGEYTGFYVYYTKNGEHFHAKRYCGDMSGATKETLASAISAGKTVCPKCIDTSSVNTVYCRPDSRYYHTNSRCSGMTNATKLTLSIAVANGKTACPTCAGGEMTGGNTGSTENNTTGGTTANVEKVYIATNGTYYHKSANTCGLTNGNATTKERAVQIYEKSPCPKCYDLVVDSTDDGTVNVLTSVFWNPNGENFHIDEDCKGMKGAKEGTVAQAKAAGKTACEKCFSTANSTRVFTTGSDPYFHNKSTCGGEKKTIATTYTKAVQAGKKGCPSCTGKNNANPDAGKVYATLTSIYYHKTSDCEHEELEGASLISLEKAEAYAKTACPECY